MDAHSMYDVADSELMSSDGAEQVHFLPSLLAFLLSPSADVCIVIGAMPCMKCGLTDTRIIYQW